MTTRVLYAGSSIRVVVQPRAILGTAIVNGRLVISYSDDTSEDVGYIGGTGLYVTSGYVADGYVA